MYIHQIQKWAHKNVIHYYCLNKHRNDIPVNKVTFTEFQKTQDIIPKLKIPLHFPHQKDLVLSRPQAGLLDFNIVCVLCTLFNALKNVILTLSKTQWNTYSLAENTEIGGKNIQ